jgi:hypothetical protein
VGTPHPPMSWHGGGVGPWAVPTRRRADSQHQFRLMSQCFFGSVVRGVGKGAKWLYQKGVGSIWRIRGSEGSRKRRVETPIDGQKKLVRVCGGWLTAAHPEAGISTRDRGLAILRDARMISLDVSGMIGSDRGLALPRPARAARAPLPDRALSWDRWGKLAAVHDGWKLAGQIDNHRGRFAAALPQIEAAVRARLPARGHWRDARPRRGGAGVVRRDEAPVDRLVHAIDPVKIGPSDRITLTMLDHQKPGDMDRKIADVFRVGIFSFALACGMSALTAYRIRGMGGPVAFSIVASVAFLGFSVLCGVLYRIKVGKIRGERDELS